MAKLLLGLLIVLAVAVAIVAGGCDGDREDMIRECKKYEMFPAEPKIKPSLACCAVWKKADIPCLCKRVTKEVEKEWCMEKVAYVANFCGKAFKPGYKCGSYTFSSINH
ncbi:unnamed protein product [Urochloa humidicola]